MFPLYSIIGAFLCFLNALIVKYDYLTMFIRPSTLLGGGFFISTKKEPKKMNGQKVIVLGVSRYSFPNQETGEIIEGTKVNFIDTDEAKENDFLGFKQQTQNMPYALFGQFSNENLPGIYEMESKVDFSGKQLKIKITGFKFVSKLNLMGQQPARA